MEIVVVDEDIVALHTMDKVAIMEVGIHKEVVTETIGVEAVVVDGATFSGVSVVLSGAAAIVKILMHAVMQQGLVRLVSIKEEKWRKGTNGLVSFCVCGSRMF